MDRTNDDKIDLFEGFDRLGISLEDLWLDAYALGGDLSLLETEAYVFGLLRDAHEHNVLAQALNERFMDQDLDHLVRYMTLAPS
ncbi:MAG: hypothetical protein ABI137_01885 [Antricoccus sp.]